MKKKTASIILSIIMILSLFTACSKVEENKTVTPAQGFTCKASLNYNDMDIVADIEHTAPGICKVTILEPDNIKGIEANWEAGKITLSFMGLSMEVDPDEFPATAFVPAILDVMDRLSVAGEIQLEKDENGEECLYTGISNNGEFIAEVDKDTGYIESIKIPAYDLKVDITEFTPINSN